MRQERRLRRIKRAENRLDPFAWISQSLPPKLRKRCRQLLSEIEDDIYWNPFTGEVTIVEDGYPLPGSNIIDITYHALEKGKLEPTGYSDVYEYLPPDSTPPTDDETSDDDVSQQKSTKENSSTSDSKADNVNNKTSSKTVTNNSQENKTRQWKGIKDIQQSK